MLLEATLDAAVFTGNHFAVPVFRSATGETQVRVALSYSQVAGTLLGVALRLTTTAREAVLAVWVALAELFTEILSHDAGAGAVAGAVRVVTGLVVVHLRGVVVFLQLDFPAVRGPQPVLSFLLLGGVHEFISWQFQDQRFFDCKLKDLLTRLGPQKSGY